MADGTEGRGRITAAGCTEEPTVERWLCWLITLVENLLMAANTGESDTVFRMEIISKFELAYDSLRVDASEERLMLHSPSSNPQALLLHIKSH